LSPEVEVDLGNNEIAFIISLRTEQMIFVLPACDFANIVLKRLTVNMRSLIS